MNERIKHAQERMHGETPDRAGADRIDGLRRDMRDRYGMGPNVCMPPSLFRVEASYSTSLAPNKYGNAIFGQHPQSSSAPNLLYRHRRPAPCTRTVQIRKPGTEMGWRRGRRCASERQKQQAFALLRA